MRKSILFVILLFFGISYGEEYDVKTITTIMDAYEKQIDSIKLKYTYAMATFDDDGNQYYKFVKGTFAQKISEGYVLLDEITQRGQVWDNSKEPEGISRSYNGEITRYLEHEKNKNGYHMAALYKEHNPEQYKTKSNPYYYVRGVNYKRKFIDLLNDPSSMAEVKGEEYVNGFKAVKINFKSYNGSLDCDLWLLPEKNYLPIKYISRRVADGKRVQETQLSDYKEIDNGTWYPMAVTIYYKHLEVPTTVKVEEIDSTPLTKEDFSFSFPAFTHVTDHLLGTSYLTTEPISSSGIEEAPLATTQLSNNEKEIILDKYLEDNKVTDSKKLNVVNATAKLGTEASLKGNPKKIFYWLIVLLVFALIGSGLLLTLFLRNKS